MISPFAAAQAFSVTDRRMDQEVSTLAQQLPLIPELTFRKDAQSDLQVVTSSLTMTVEPKVCKQTIFNYIPFLFIEEVKIIYVGRFCFMSFQTIAGDEACVSMDIFERGELNFYNEAFFLKRERTNPSSFERLLIPKTKIYRRYVDDYIDNDKPGVILSHTVSIDLTSSAEKIPYEIIAPLEKNIINKPSIFWVNRPKVNFPLFFEES
jgi:hypothetical protein